MTNALTMTATTDVGDLEEFRQGARRWLAENMQRREGPVETHEVDYYTPEVMAVGRALQRKLYEGGYAGLTWPKEYGGRGLANAYASAFAVEAEDYVLPDFGALSGITFGVCVPMMLAHASPELLRDFVPKVLAGEALVCQFFSEPSAGSDLAGVRTSAVRDGSEWVLNGQKIWSTFAHKADWGLCLARTDPNVPKHRGLTWFAVPTNAPGLTIRPIKRISESAEFCEDFFDDVVIPDIQRLGEVNQGWTVTQTMLVYERGAGRPDAERQLTGPGDLAPDLVELALKAGRQSDPVVRQKVARAHTNDFVGKALASRIAQIGRLGSLNPAVAAYGKLFRGVYTPIRARIGVEVGGGGAMTWDTGDVAGMATSQAYLKGREGSIAAGTNEVQRNGIGERSLGLPREPSFDTNKPFNEVLRDAKNWNTKQ